MDTHLFLPLIVPMIGAALAVLVARSRMVARAIVIAVASFNTAYGLWLIQRVASEGRQVVQSGNWPAPFGISLVADGLGAIMITLAGMLILTTAIYSFASLDKRYDKFYYYPLLLLLLLGVSGAFITGDLFNLYVWFEVLLLSSFGLLVLGGTRGQLEGGLKYVVLNLIGSTTFLAGCGLVYGVAGTLNMAHLAERLSTIEAPGLTTALAALFLVAYGVKSAIVPFFFWLPTSYHTPPVAVTAVFSGLLTKVGVYSLYRVLGTIFQNDLTGVLSPLILWLAGLTMVLGVFGAVAQLNVRRILSFHIVSQIGYAIMGLGLASAAGMAAGILFLAHVIIVKTALFFIGGAAEHIYGTGDLKKMGGLAKREPVLATFWLLGILSLAGIPPLSGFFGKLYLLQVGVQQQAYWITGIAAAVSILTFFSMLKIWNEVFWKKPKVDTSQLPRVPLGQLIPGAVLVLLSVGLGIVATPLVEFSALAGTQVFDVPGYVTDVCGATGCDAAVPAAVQP